MKKEFIRFLIISTIVLFFGGYTFANTTTYDDGSSMNITTYDDGSTLRTTTDTNGNITYSSTNATDGGSSSDNILGLSTADLRSGNVDMNTIPDVIVSVIQTLLALAGTFAIFSLIYHAVQMQINSGITGDSSGVDKAKKGMIGSLIGFVIAISAWFLVTRAVELLGAVS